MIEGITIIFAAQAFADYVLPWFNWRMEMSALKWKIWLLEKQGV
jgi:hypothetical protein